MNTSFINRKSIISIIVFIFILISIPFTFYLAQKTQIFKPRASSTGPSGPDLDVLNIERNPKYQWYHYYDILYGGNHGAPVLRSGAENLKRWPVRGETVTFKAVVENKGNQDTSTFNYKWYIDGTEVSSGTGQNLTAGQKGEFTYNWSWDHDTIDSGQKLTGEHRVKFVADVTNNITEVSEQNNQIEDYTNAIPFRIFFDQNQYNAFKTKRNRKDSYSPEDWFRDQFEELVRRLETNGAQERIRIDKFFLVPAGQNVEAAKMAEPNRGETDATWQLICGNDTTFCEAWATERMNTIDGGLLHELVHQLGINHTGEWSIEEGFLNKVQDKDGNQLRITASNKYPDDMSYGVGSPKVERKNYGEYSIKALNANKGYRRGYYGEYMYDIPLENKLRILDINGNPLPNAEIKMFQKGGQSFYFPLSQLDFKVTDNTPEFQGTTDSNGFFTLTNKNLPLTAFTTKTNHQVKPNPFGIVDVNNKNTNFIITISKDGQFDNSHLDISELNMAYWSGQTVSATYTINSLISQVSLNAPTISGLFQNRTVRLNWNEVSNASKYFIYRSSYPDYEWEKISEVTTTTFTQPGAIDSKSVKYAVAAVDNSGSVGHISNVFRVEDFGDPSKVLIDSQGNRLIYGGEYLYVQKPDGNFIGKLGTDHYRILGGVNFSKTTPQKIITGKSIFDYDLGNRDLEEKSRLSVTNNNTTTYDIASASTYLVFTDPTNNKLIVTDLNGAIQTNITQVGSITLSGPKGIDIQGDTFFVSDAANRVVILNYNPNTRAVTLVREITGLARPSGISAVGEYFAVAETGNNKIKLYQTNGTLVSEYTAPNDRYTGNFSRPEGVTIVAGNPAKIIAADSGNQRVVDITTTSNIQPTSTSPTTPSPVQSPSPSPTPIPIQSPSPSPSPSFVPVQSPSPIPSPSPSLLTSPSPSPVVSSPTPLQSSSPTPTPSPTQKTVSLITIADVGSLSFAGLPAQINLSGRLDAERGYLAPVSVTFSDRSTRNFVIKFVYQGSIASPSPSPIQSPSPVSSASPHPSASAEPPPASSPSSAPSPSPSPSPAAPPAASPTPQPSPQVTVTRLEIIQKYDISGDKEINSIDFSLLFREWRKPKQQADKKVDFNNDGAINAFDYSILKTNFIIIRSLPASGQALQVPSPSLSPAPSSSPDQSSSSSPSPSFSPLPAISEIEVKEERLSLAGLALPLTLSGQAGSYIDVPVKVKLNNNSFKNYIIRFLYQPTTAPSQSPISFASPQPSASAEPSPVSSPSPVPSSSPSPLPEQSPSPSPSPSPIPAT